MAESKAREESNRSRHGVWSRPTTSYLLGVPVGGILMFVVGIVFWGGFNTAMEITNTEEFCIGCHEMREYVYPEYVKTAHYKNRTGVRATCPDCHVPRPWIHKMARKITASNELLHKLLGTVDTPEKFAARRLVLAQAVWREMAATDSRECRNCHSFLYMDLSKQDRNTQKDHSPEIARESGKTCIDCHKGVAHNLPQGMDKPGLSSELTDRPRSVR